MIQKSDIRCQMPVIRSLFCLLTSVICLLTSACGFEPVYGTLGQDNSYEATTESALAQVDIVNIPDREGQYLRNALIDRFYHHARPAHPQYVLSVEPIKERLRGLDITKSSDATRGQLKLTTTMALVDKTTGATVLERDLRSITSYNILGSEFTNRVSKQNARENALEDLARQIELQLSLYFKR